MRVLIAVLLGVLLLPGCAQGPAHADKEPTVDQRLKLIHKQDAIPQASKDGIDQLVTAYKDKDEFEKTASH